MPTNLPGMAAMQDGTILAVGPEHPCNHRRGKVSREDSRQAYPGCRESNPPSPGTAWQLQAALSSRSCVVLRPHGASSVRGRVPMRKEHCFLHPSAITHHPSGSWLPTPGRPSRTYDCRIIQSFVICHEQDRLAGYYYYCYLIVITLLRILGDLPWPPSLFYSWSAPLAYAAHRICSGCLDWSATSELIPNPQPAKE